MTRLGLFLSAVLLTGATFGWGCRDANSGRGGRSEKVRGVAEGCNVLLLTLDTTRADRLGCYGWKSALTPTLDGLAERGVRFTQAFSPMGLTHPAHTVLMTGTYPPENGVRDNFRHLLGPELPTLAQIFRDRGYRTGAFIAAEVLKGRFGLARGFDVYEDKMQYYRRQANEVVDVALPWFEEKSDKPFFAWVHFYDPHWPYTPPREYFQKTARPYDAAVAFMDDQIGRLLGWLDASHQRSRTLVIAVADHGESLGEHGYEAHALLIYDSILKVPLIISLPGRLPEGSTVDDLVRLPDIMPTILDLLGWPPPAEVSGESFSAALGGQRLAERAAYGESEFGYYSFGWSKLQCLVEPKWKYIRAPRIELYDRVADPGELHNLAEAEPDRAVRMEDSLSDWETRMPRRQSLAAAEDAESLAALRALGYVGGQPPATAPGALLRDPKDVADVANNYRRAVDALRANQPLVAMELMEAARRRSPESPAIADLLGKAYANAGLTDFAQLALEEAIALSPNEVDSWLSLAEVLRARHAFERARSACEHILALDAGNEKATTMLAQLERDIEQRVAVMKELRQRLMNDADAPRAAAQLAKELVATGALAEAVELLKNGLSKHPDHPVLANELAWLLATYPQDDLRDGTEALRLARLSCRGGNAANPRALDTLAAAQAETGDFAGAVETIRRALKLAGEAEQEHLAALLLRRLAYYEAKRPFRTPE